MVKVGGRPILHRQLDALAAAGVDDVVIVRGYLGDRIAPPAGGPPLRFVDNPDWAENNIFTSLFYAEREMEDGFLFSYSDIVFAPEHARRLAEAPGPVALVIDRRWRDAYDGRTLHPVSEAELARVDGAGAAAAVTRVGKRLVAEDEAAGEFIGLARFSAEGAAALAEVWREARARGRGAPFGAAATLGQAYLTDGLNALVARGVATAAAVHRRALARDRHRSRIWPAPRRRRRLGPSMPGPDPAHWLHRLTAEEWLAAAATELAHAEAALARRAPRPGVTHARRAAGMAWNAVLTRHPDERYGRSYMDHVVALSTNASVPEAIRAAAQRLRDTPARQPELVTLGSRASAQDLGPAHDARFDPGPRPQRSVGELTAATRPGPPARPDPPRPAPTRPDPPRPQTIVNHLARGKHLASGPDASGRLRTFCGA